MELKPLELGYWKIRGLGRPIATLLAYCNVPFNYSRMTSFKQWSSKREQLFSNGFDRVNLPYLLDPNTDKQVSESLAILYYVAQKYGPELAPTSLGEVTEFIQMEGIIGDINSAITKPAYQAADLETLKTQVTNRFNSMKKKQKILSDRLSGQGWILGEKMTYLDFFLAESLEKLMTMEEDLKFETFDKELSEVVKAYVGRFNALEKVKSFRESEKALDRPFNGVPMAKWG